MTADYGLTEADKADLHARLTSWFGDDRQAFLVSHLAPLVDRIKADAYAAGIAAAETRVAEFHAQAPARALREAAQFFEHEMSRAWGGIADWLTTGTRIAELVADILRERAADLDAERVAGVLRDVAAATDGSDDCSDTCPDCGGKWVESMREGCKRPWHHADQWADTYDECDHDWLDRPESDTRECLICGDER